MSVIASGPAFQRAAALPPKPQTPTLLRSRPLRVVILAASTVVLGLADLWITMTYLLSIGMFEDNPIARFVINLGSPALVIAFKLATMVLVAAVTLAFRRRWQAEALGWITTAIMAMLFVHWLSYIEYAGLTTGSMAVVALDPSYADGTWVSLR